MMRRYLVGSLALGLLACNADQEFAEGIPSAEQVSIKVPASGGQQAQKSVDGLGEARGALVGATSELYQITYGVSATVNGGTVLLLGALRLVTLQTPTSRTADSRTWGPYPAGGLDPLTYRLVVRKLGELHFGFSLDASSRLAADPSAFLPLIDGEITKGLRAGTAQGTMTLHFDNRRVLVPEACEEGTLAFQFDDTGDAAVNDVTLHDFANANAKNVLCKQEKPIEAAYHYAKDAAGAGEFVFSVTKDMVQPLGQAAAVDENVTLRSRWQASGAGRSDVLVSGGDVDAALAAHGLVGPATASQCWDTRYQTQYETSSPAELEIMGTSGAASACVFTSAELPQ